MEDITKCARSLDDKYAEQKEFIRIMAMALISEDLPLHPEDHKAAVKTTDNGDCLYNAVLLALMGSVESVQEILSRFFSAPLFLLW